jgi:hypothetical protein
MLSEFNEYMTDWNPIESLIKNAAIRRHNNEIAVRHVLAYWRAMNDVERQFLTASDDQFDEVVAAKTKVHEMFWAASDDDYWKPCSKGSSEEYSLKDIDEVFVMSDLRSSFFVRLAIRQDSNRFGKRDVGYLLQTSDGTAEGPVRIVDEFS